MKSCGCLSSLRSRPQREDSTRADVGTTTTPLSCRKLTCPIAECGVRVGSWPDTDKEAAKEMPGSWSHILGIYGILHAVQCRRDASKVITRK